MPPATSQVARLGSSGARAVLIGIPGFDELPSLPAVANNLEALSRLLRSSDVFGMSEDHCAVLTGSVNPAQIDKVVRSAARTAEKALIIYYAGHGLIDPVDGSLYLAVKNSDPDLVASTAVPYEWIRRAVVVGPAIRVIVLDCCFSARALNTMSGGLGIADSAEVEGTAVLAAAARNVKAVSPEGEQYTAFTGELVAILESGLALDQEFITLDWIYREMERSLRSKGRPIPQRAFRNTVGELAFRNRAWASPGQAADAFPSKATDAPADEIPSLAATNPLSESALLLISHANSSRTVAEALVRHIEASAVPRTRILTHSASLSEALGTGQIIIALIDPQYLVDPEIALSHSLQAVRRQDGEPDSVLIPVIARSCNWERTPIGEMQILPRDGRPLDQLTDLDAGLADIAEEITAIARRRRGVLQPRRLRR